MLIGLLSIPLLINGIGIERFGLLSIAWMLVGYFGVLDMGIGRALTQKVADRVGQGKTKNLKSLIASSLTLIFVFGMLGSALLYELSGMIVYQWLTISSEILEESFNAFFWLSLTIPIVILSNGFLGVLEGQQYFGWTAIIRAPLGVMMFLAPLIVMHWSIQLDMLIQSLFLVRAFFLIVTMLVVSYTTKTFTGWESELSELKSLFSYGGWVTLSNLISPLMVYFDRFYIGAVLSVAVVAFYTTPFDLLTKALIIPFALIGVMFASFAAEWKQNANKVKRQFKYSVLIVILFMFPFSLLVALFANELMSLWLGSEFAQESYQIVQWIALGIFFNAVAMTPFAFIQAIGRADLTAKLHLLELPIYLLILWYAVEQFGLLGAAIAWVVRVLVDSILLFFLSYYLMKEK